MPQGDPVLERLRAEVNRLLAYAANNAEAAHGTAMKLADALTDWFEVLNEAQRGNRGARAEATYHDEFLDKLGQMLNQTLDRLGELDAAARRGLEADVERARAVATDREKLAAIGQLSAGVAHEINNPLSFVKANLSALDGYLNELEPWRGAATCSAAGGAAVSEIFDELRAATRESLVGVERMVAIVAALKGVTRNRPEDRGAFNPAQAIRDSVLVFQGAKRNVCEVDLELGDLPLVVGSAGALGQVVLNLMENALDAMGGRGRIRVVGAAHEGWAVFEVADSGPGIPEAIRGRIFEPFFTTKEVGKGTGLGLYICYEAVREMNGELTFSCDEGGTTFAIRLRAAV